MKKILYFILGAILFSGTIAFAAPYFQYSRSFLPIDSTENIGTTTAPWDEGHFNEICLTADCRTAWPASGSGALEFDYGTNIYSQTSAATSSALEINSTGTSTFAGGIESWRQVGAPYFHATSTTATSTWAGPIVMNGPTAGGPNLLFLDCNKDYYTGVEVPTDGCLNIDSTPNNSVGLQVYSNAGSGANSPLVLFRADNTAFDDGILRLIQDGTAGGAYNIRMDGPAPQIELVETDQTSPNGKWELGANGDNFYVASRNQADNSFETGLFDLRQLNNGGMLGIGSTSPWAKLSVQATTSMPAGSPLFVVANTSATPKFIVDSAYNVGIGTTSPMSTFAVVGTTTLATTTTSSLNGVIVVDGVHYPQTGAGIQSAVNNCNNLSSCSKVFLPPATYSVSDKITIPSNITLEGSGYGSHLKLANSVNGIMVQNSATSTGNTNIVIRNIRFDGNASNQTSQVDLLSFTNIASSTIEGNWVENSKWSHITLERSTGNIVRNNIITGGNGHGILLSRDNVEFIGSKNNIITGNVVSGIGLDGGIDFGGGSVKGYGIYLYSDSDKNIVSNNQIKDLNGHGIAISLANNSGASSTDNVIEGNQIENAGMINSSGRSHFGVYLDRVEKNLVVNNIIASSSVYGISLVDGVENKVQGNRIFNSQQHGILLTNSHHNSILDNFSYNNGQLTPNTYSGIHLGHTVGGNSSYNQIRGNYVYDNQTVPTQKHGIRETNTTAAPNQESNYNDISFNYLNRNLDIALVSSGINNQVMGNVGATTTGMLLGVGTNVGIGTSSPYATLSVTNVGTADSFAVEDATSPDTSRFVVNSSGDVGIKIQQPLFDFHVNGVGVIGDSSNGVNLGNFGAPLSSSPGVMVGRSSGAGSGIFATAGHLVFQPRGSATLRDIYFLDGDGSENVVIKDGGNVGISTTTPAWKLQVVQTTAPQLALTDSGAGTDLKHWTMRSVGGSLYFATSTDAYATSTKAALSIDPNGLTTFLGRFRGGRQTLLQFTAADNDPPSTNFATFDTRNDHPVLTFGSTATSSAMFKGIMPQVYGGNGVSVILHFAQSTSTITDSVNWSVAFERLLDGTDDLDNWGFAATTTVTATPNGTSGVLATATLNFAEGTAMDSVAIGDTFRISVARDLNDTSSTTQQLLSVEIREQ